VIDFVGRGLDPPNKLGLELIGLVGVFVLVEIACVLLLRVFVRSGAPVETAVVVLELLCTVDVPPPDPPFPLTVVVDVFPRFDCVKSGAVVVSVDPLAVAGIALE
jgi:hypothetical protein